MSFVLLLNIQKRSLNFKRRGGTLQTHDNDPLIYTFADILLFKNNKVHIIQGGMLSYNHTHQKMLARLSLNSIFFMWFPEQPLHFFYIHRYICSVVLSKKIHTFITSVQLQNLYFAGHLKSSNDLKSQNLVDIDVICVCFYYSYNFTSPMN